MSIRAVAFDVDGTLYPDLSMYLNSVPFALRHLRLMFAFARVRKRLRETVSSDGFRLAQSNLLAAELGIDAARAEKLIDKRIYTEWESTLRRVKPFKHLRMTLGALKSRGLKLALLSDFPIGRKLEYLGLDGFWDFTLCAEDVGFLKPHEKPFLELIEHLAVAPEELVYVGNHYRYDVLGAKGVGARTAHLTRRAQAASAADFSFWDYRELSAWILEGKL